MSGIVVDSGTALCFVLTQVSQHWKEKECTTVWHKTQLGIQSALCFQCSGNMEFAPSRKVTKLFLRLQRTRCVMCREKNKSFLIGVTKRLGSD